MERKEQKESDLESVKCYKPQNCKTPGNEKKNVLLEEESQGWKGWELCACRIEAEKGVHR